MPGPAAPFVRFSRDKRGYEHVYLVHAGGGRGAPRARVLYWYRTPPDVKVGRQPFDDQVQKALEAQYPELRFEWKRIVEAQAPPPPEVEQWRERRRAERSAKQERTALSREVAVSAEPAPEESEISSTALVLAEPLPAVTVASILEPVVESESALADGPAESGERHELADDQGARGKEPAAADVPTTHVVVRGRRRRGGRRRRRGTRGGAMQPSVIAGPVDWPAAEPPAPAGPQAEGEVAEAAETLPQGENDETRDSDSTS